MLRLGVLAALLLLAGCDAGLPLGDAQGSAGQRLPACEGISDAALTEVYAQIEAAAGEDLSRAEVLGVGLASGCLAECFDCWIAITDDVFLGGR